MAKELYDILYGNAHIATGGYFEPAYKGEDSFLQKVITPIYQVLRKEVQRNNAGTASHSKWRNYDDLNEYFWSTKCFELDWPMKTNTDFFVQMGDRAKMEHPDQVVSGRRKPKTNFVEVRTFWHLFRSFDRMWAFFILAFQAMVIIAWSPTASPSAIFEPDVFRSVLSVFLTAALLNFLQAVLDIILSWKAWGSMGCTQITRYLLKLVMAAVWLIILPISYSSSMQNPTGLIKFFSNWFGNSKQLSFYSFAIVIYMLPNILMSQPVMSAYGQKSHVPTHAKSQAVRSMGLSVHKWAREPSFLRPWIEIVAGNGAEPRKAGSVAATRPAQSASVYEEYGRASDRSPPKTPGPCSHVCTSDSSSLRGMALGRIFKHV
ncbi:hypothetical protein Taro_009522 [Colocasia esculenta]|uniref:1,3-beta-glucan synthase component FKS1-like domain-containing protein n=1 Tax=Colocasia esculenta TaxID=4460 RepID=A0A843U6S6_COLES|nr:hypothetical protein [Colocasia esculenta]